MKKTTQHLRGVHLGNDAPLNVGDVFSILARQIQSQGLDWKKYEGFR